MNTEQQPPPIQNVADPNLNIAPLISPKVEESQAGGSGERERFDRGDRGGFDQRRGRGRGRGGPRGNRGFSDRGDRGDRGGRGGWRSDNRGPRGGGRDGGDGGGWKPANGEEGDYDGGPMGGHRGERLDRVQEKLSQMRGPTYDLPAVEIEEKKFSGRTRMYLGNVSPETTEEDLKELFSKYGELGEIFMNKEKNFSFIKMDYVPSAEKAKRELNGHVLHGKTLRIRLAPNNVAVKLKNLSPFVSNELLYHAFSVFGEVERAMVLVDERGRPTGEGVVEYARKGSATNAIRRCQDRCFFLTSSLRPVIVESHESVVDTDGYPERFIQKRNPDYMKEREVGPRFAEQNSFEEEYGVRWKQLFELHNEKLGILKKELQMEMEKLEAQMEYAKYEHETAMLREQLRQREMDRERQKQDWEMKERMVEEQRRRNEEELKRKEDNLAQRIIKQEEDLKRRKQETSLFMQAHQLTSMLDQQEQSYEQQNYQPDGGNNEQRMGGDNNWFQPANNNKGGWVNERRDDYPNKRRRF